MSFVNIVLDGKQLPGHNHTILIKKELKSKKIGGDASDETEREFQGFGPAMFTCTIDFNADETKEMKELWQKFQTLAQNQPKQYKLKLQDYYNTGTIKVQFTGTMQESWIGDNYEKRFSFTLVEVDSAVAKKAQRTKTASAEAPTANQVTTAETNQQETQAQQVAMNDESVLAWLNEQAKKVNEYITPATEEQTNEG